MDSFHNRERWKYGDVRLLMRFNLLPLGPLGRLCEIISVAVRGRRVVCSFNSKVRVRPNLEDLHRVGIRSCHCVSCFYRSDYIELSSI